MTNDSGSAEGQLRDARLIDRGAQAEIYEWGAGRVLRLMFDDSSTADLTREADAMRAALAAGVPVPAVYEVVTIDGRAGMVMARIDGPPMLAAALSRPWQIVGLARRFGVIHATLHQRDAPADLISTHEAARHHLHRLQPEDEWLRPWTERELDQLPTGHTLLHGDFHPANVLVDASGPQVIDWAGVASGPPEADVARTMVLIESALPPNANWFEKLLIGTVRRVFMPRYLAGYRSQRQLDMVLVRRWRMVRTVERLVEAPTSERDTLRRMIRAAGGPTDFGTH